MKTFLAPFFQSVRGIRRTCLGLLMLPALVIAQNDGDLPLPRWTEEELKSFQQQESAQQQDALLPEPPEYLRSLLDQPLRTGPRLDELPDALNADLMTGLRADHFRLFLPQMSFVSPREALPPQEAARVPTPQAMLRDVTPEFLKAAESAPAQEFLLDPQALVPEMATQELGRFLEFHARESRIRIHVLVLPKDGQIPALAQLERVAGGGLLKSDSCLLVYPVSEPWRARLFVSKAVHDRTSADFLAETARACLQNALLTQDPLDQLERFSTELSTRLFWLQKHQTQTTQKATGTDAARLHELSASGAASAAITPGFWASRGPFMLAMLMLLLVIAAAFASRHPIRRWWQARSRKYIWLLPEADPAPRLGGAFTGGAGKTVRF